MSAVESLPSVVTPWRLFIWTDERDREVKRLVCHESELSEVADLPFPPGAVAREPVYEFTAMSALMPWDFYRKHPFEVGFRFTDFINQGDRPAMIVAKNDATGDFIYEYEMPGGRVFLRSRGGRPVSLKRLPAWAREQLE